MLSVRHRAQLGLSAAVVLIGVNVTALLWMPRLSLPIAVADVGTEAPDFQLRDTDGRAVSLSDFDGQAVVLYFSSSTCTKSAAYNQRVNRLAKRYQSDPRVTFIAVDVNRAAATPVPAGREAGSTRPFRTLLDERGAVATRYSAVGDIPMVVLVDRRGRVSYRGPFDDHPDVAFATRSFCADALRDVLGAPSSALAKSH